MVTKIGNEDGAILRMHAKIEHVLSVHARTLAQNMHALPKIGYKDGAIIRMHAKFENVWSVHARMLAQNMRAQPVSHRRSDLRAWSPK